jgi:hypothetical protein
MNESIDKHFDGNKSFWRAVFDTLLNKLKECGDDIQVIPTNSYLSILKNGEKFAMIQTTSDRMDIGIKLKDAEPTDRLEASGAWNVMMTHRVRINDPKEVDKELIEWLRKAYDCN